MTRAVVAVSRDTPFKEVAQTIRRWQVSALPVLAGDGRVVGVVSEADLLAQAETSRDQAPGSKGVRSRPRLASSDPPDARTAGQLMTTPAISVQADASLPLAARTMAVYKVKRLPVTDGGGHLRGVVSRTDLLKPYLRADSDIKAEVREEVVEPLFSGEKVVVWVSEGIVWLSGAVPDTALIPVATRLARTVEGVVDVENKLHGRPRRPEVE